MLRKAIIISLIACSFSLGFDLAYGNDESDCIGKLENLGQKCLQYAKDHNGHMPSSLSELYYRAYINDLDDFQCLGHQTDLIHWTEIDAKSVFVMSKDSGQKGQRPLVQYETIDSEKGKNVYAFYSDGSVRRLNSSEKLEIKGGTARQKNGKNSNAWRTEVRINWLEDILVVKINGPSFSQLENGDSIPLEVQQEVLRFVRGVDYRDGMLLGSLMDERPALRDYVIHLIQKSHVKNVVEKTATNEIREVCIPLSKLRAAIFTSEKTQSPVDQSTYLKTESEHSEDNWQVITKEDSLKRKPPNQSSEKQSTSNQRTKSYGF